MGDLSALKLHGDFEQLQPKAVTLGERRILQPTQRREGPTRKDLTLLPPLVVGLAPSCPGEAQRFPGPSPGSDLQKEGSVEGDGWF